MRRIIQRMLATWGTDVKINHQGTASYTKAVFVPTTSRSWQNMEHVFTAVGETPRGQYNYIGALEPVAEKGDILEVGGKPYLLRRLEVVRDAKGPLYRWGLCVESGGPDSWGDRI